MGLFLFLIMLECILYFGNVYFLCYVVYSRLIGSYSDDTEKNSLNFCIFEACLILFLILYCIFLLGGFI